MGGERETMLREAQRLAHAFFSDIVGGVVYSGVSGGAVFPNAWGRPRDPFPGSCGFFLYMMDRDQLGVLNT